LEYPLTRFPFLAASAGNHRDPAMTAFDEILSGSFGAGRLSTKRLSGGRADLFSGWLRSYHSDFSFNSGRKSMAGI